MEHFWRIPLESSHLIAHETSKSLLLWPLRTQTLSSGPLAIYPVQPLCWYPFSRQYSWVESLLFKINYVDYIRRAFKIYVYRIKNDDNRILDYPLLSQRNRASSVPLRALHPHQELFRNWLLSFPQEMITILNSVLNTLLFFYIVLTHAYESLWFSFIWFCTLYTWNITEYIHFWLVFQHYDFVGPELTHKEPLDS